MWLSMTIECTRLLGLEGLKNNQLTVCEGFGWALLPLSLIVVCVDRDFVWDLRTIRLELDAIAVSGFELSFNRVSGRVPGRNAAEGGN